MYFQIFVRRIILLLVVALVSIPAESQDFHFRGYTTSTEPALSSRFVNTINQDENGFIWIGTGSGLNRFDGKVFRTDFLPDSLAEINLTSSFKANNGNLWFGSNDGIILRFDGKDFQIISMREYTSNAITGFVESPDQEILVSTQNSGLFKINHAKKDAVLQFPVDQALIHCISKTTDNKLLVGTNDGLFLYTLPNGDQPPLLIRKFEDVPSIAIQIIIVSQTTNLIYIGTAGEGLYILRKGAGTDDHEIVPLTEGTELESLNIKSIVEDVDKNIWLSSQRSGVIKIPYPYEGQASLQYHSYEKQNGLLSNNTNSVFQDNEGNIWIGTYGGGLSMLIDEAFTFYTFNEAFPGSSINALTADEQNYYVLGDNGIQVVEKETGTKKEVYSAKNGLPADKLTSIYLSEDTKDLWIGTAGSGLYRLSLRDGRAKSYFKSNDDNENSVSSIAGEKSNIWISTKNGIFLFNIKSSEREHFTVSSGALPHNDIKHLFLDDEKKLWFSTLSDDLYYLTGSGGQKAGLLSMGTGFEFRAITKDHNGEIWAATYGNGVMHITSDSVYFVTTESGLKSKYCYSILIDTEENVWVGHRQGYSRIRMEGENHLIRTYGAGEGVSGEANSNAIHLDNEGRVLLGTTKGMVVYDHRKDSKSLSAPQINVTSITFIDEIDEGEIIPYSEKIVMPYSNYKLRIEFVGISFHDPEAVTFRYKLDNYDNEWSDLSPQTFAEFPKLDDGEYKFWLNAYNAEFKSNDEPFSFTILIKKPIWKTWWFFSLIAILFVAIVVVIIKVRERNLKKQEAYLKKELNIRTKEVVRQKEEIEVKNRDITDSINYAQRIQASILPPLQKLRENFSGTFVYYQPRDIVSGDFYWWDRIDDDRFLVVCADSTGHGVPGAFMSMIGSTLIKDIVNRNRQISPSSLLTILNKEVVESLNQGLDLENLSDDEERLNTTDGMDIIVCEFNTKTLLLKFASAMRPLIMYHKGEQYYIRGQRSSVGGGFMKDKRFEDQEYQLVKGDIVYLFSDGYPDQFGGPSGKKFKMVALKGLLEDIHTKNMDEQYAEIKEKFETWKAEQDQVDDVLFMGIQV